MARRLDSRPAKEPAERGKILTYPASAPVPGSPIVGTAAVRIEGLTVKAGRRTLLRGVNLEVPEHRVCCVIGPSGVGKSTLLRCLNRMIDLDPGLTTEGEVRIDGFPIYSGGIDPDRLRARVGMLFQQPVIFPGSVYKNVIFGLRHAGGVPRRRWGERAEEALRRSALWEEVDDRLDDPASELSVGQQQRLCLARALALDPPLLLMDEPTSSLDPRSTEAIEGLIRELAKTRTVVMVTHDLEQAKRVADLVACVCPRADAGELLECAGPETLFREPRCREVCEYLGYPEPPDAEK